MSKLYQIPKFLYDKTIYSYIESLIKEGAISYGELFGTEKDEIVTRIISVLGTDCYELFIGSDDFEKSLKYFSNFLKTASSSDAYDFLYQMRTNAQNQYEYDIEQLFLEIQESHENTRRRQAGLRPCIDKQTGELEWRQYA